MRLLAIETATDACSIALMEDDDVIAEASLNRPRQHASHLAPLIASLLRHCEWQARDLDVIAISAGPGSYTGLRIGVSTTKGLAMATSAAIVAVPTLEAFAMRAVPRAVPGQIVMPLFDARRESVYAGAWRVMTDGSLECLVGSQALELADVRATLKSFDASVHLLGDGIKVIGLGDAAIDDVVPSGDVLDGGPLDERRTHGAALDAAVHSHTDLAPHASAVAILGKRMFDAGITAELASFEPDYLREFVAKTPARSAFAKLGF